MLTLLELSARRVEDTLRALGLGPQTIVVNPHIYTLLTSVEGYDKSCIAVSPHDPYLHVVTMTVQPTVQRVEPNYWQPKAVANLTHLDVARVVQSIAEHELALGEAGQLNSTARFVAAQIIALRGKRLWTPHVGKKPEQAVIDLLAAREPEGWADVANALSPPDMSTQPETDQINLAAALVLLARQLLNLPAH